ncbi:MAG: hypothetical protein IJ720_06065 [Clostridia bacterium]|nr:hypothetical protein [Clostridia bacterium]
MAMKDILDRFKREAPEEPVPEETPVTEEKTSFVFTDINSEPISPTEPVAETPVHSGPVKVSSSDNDRIQVFELNLGGSKVNVPEEPAVQPEVSFNKAPADKVPDIPEPPVIEEETITVAPTPAADDGTEEYEVDFGYAAPGALDDVTYTTDPASVPNPQVPEPIVYKEEAPADNGDEEYYDSYEPIYEESYTPGSYFAGGTGAEPVAPEPEPYIAPEAPKVVEETVEAPTYADAEDRPRYENYREDYVDTPDAEPRSYENNIDDSVFLPDQEEAPFNSKKNRRRLTVALLALLAALLLVFGGILISHFVGRSNDAAEATSAKAKTTAFERSVSNNKNATETTTELEEETVQYDENGEIQTESSSVSTSAQSTTRRTSTTTRSTSTGTTTTRTTRTTTTTTRTTTASTTAPTTTAPATQPSTDPPTTSSRSVPSPSEYASQRNQ